MSHTVVVDNQLLWRIMHHPVFQDQFPFLRSAALQSSARRGGCGGCGRNRNAAADPPLDFGRLKQSLARMPDNDKRRFKDLLKAEKVEIIYMDDQQRKVKLRF